MYGFNVFKVDSIGNFCGNPNFLSCTIDEFEMCLRKENCQRNTRKASSCTEIENFCSRFKGDGFGNGQGMEYVVLVEVVDVLSTDDVDFRIPIAVEGIKL